MMRGNHRTSCTFTIPKRIPTFMASWLHAFLSLGNNVFVDSLYEPTLEPSIHTLRSLRIISMAYQYRQSGQGRMPMSVEGCHHLPTHSRKSRLCLATATNHQGYENPCDACINAGGFLPSSLARLRFVGIARSPHSARTMRSQCPNLALIYDFVLCVQLILVQRLAWLVSDTGGKWVVLIRDLPVFWIGEGGGQQKGL